MRTSVLLSVAGLAAAAATAAVAAPATAASPDYFVVNTQFWGEPSPIVEAGGSFADCTSVTDLFNGAEQIAARKLLFFGDKRVDCADGSVVIHYVAEFNFVAARRTSGHWYVVESTVPGIGEGYGTVRGDSTACELLAGSEGCIRDTFAGNTA